jgi:hypothetical protein
LQLRFGLRAHEREHRKTERIGHVLNRHTITQTRNRGMERAVELLERVRIVRPVLDRDLERAADALLIEQ